MATMRTPAPPLDTRHTASPVCGLNCGGLRPFLGAFALSGRPVNVRDYEALAAERLDENALAYFAGGAGDEWTLRENEPRSSAASCGRGCSSTSPRSRPRRPSSATTSRCRSWSRRSPSSAWPTRRGRARPREPRPPPGRHVPLDRGDEQPGRGSRRRAGREALVPGLRLPRPIGDGEPDRGGDRQRLQRARPHRRRAVPRAGASATSGSTSSSPSSWCRTRSG